MGKYGRSYKRSSEGGARQAHELTAFAQALTLGAEVACAYAEAITLLRSLESSPVDAAALVGLDAAALYRLNQVFAQARHCLELDTLWLCLEWLLRRANATCPVHCVRRSRAKQV